MNVYESSLFQVSLLTVYSDRSGRRIEANREMKKIKIPDEELNYIPYFVSTGFSLYDAAEEQFEKALLLLCFQKKNRNIYYL